MEKIITYEFDNIITFSFTATGTDPSQACYGTLPKAEYLPGALASIRRDRALGRLLVLHAEGDERIIKEALWVLGSCTYFDRFIIDSEWSGT